MYQVLSFMPFFYLLYIFTNNIVKKNIKSNIVSYDVVTQTIIGTIHTYYIIIIGIAIQYMSDYYKEIFKNNVISFSISYFMHDMGFIFLKDRTQMMYIPHHILAIGLLYSLKKNYINFYLMTLYFFYLELSNAVLSLWDLSRKYKLTLPYIYNNLTPYMVTAYVPIRCVVIPVVSILNIINILQYRLILAPIYSILAIISLVYSYKLIKILKYKLNTVNDKTHYTFYKIDKYWFGNITYLIKIFINIFLIIHVIPYSNNKLRLLIYIIYDFIHTAISITYYATNFNEKYYKYDFMSILFKITLAGLVNTFDINFTNIILNSASIIQLLQTNHHFLKENGKYIFKNRFNILSAIFITNSAISIIHYIKTKDINNIVSIIIYTIGCYIYKKEYNKEGIFNYLGWMHICITIADIFLLKQISNYV